MDKQREFAPHKPAKIYIIENIIKLTKETNILLSNHNKSDLRGDYRNKFPSLFFPYSSCHSKLQLLPLSPWEEQSHVTLDNETIETVTNLPMTVPYAPGYPLPNHFPPTPTYLKAVAIIFCLVVVTHKPQESYINRRDAKLKRFEMQAKVLTKATENLKIEKRNPTISAIPLTESSEKI